MDKLVNFFHKKYYPDMDINEVSNAFKNPKIKKSAVTFLQKKYYPDMNVSDLLSEKPPKYAKKEAEMFLDKRKHKKGRLTMSEAMDYIDKSGLKGQKAYDFLREWSPSTISTIYNPQGLQRRRLDPTFKPPITKTELEDYQLYEAEKNKRLSDKTPDELQEFLIKNQYNPVSSGTLTGKQIIKNAQSKGNKVKLEPNEDGSFTIYDDESVFKDTEDSFGKGIKIYPNATYSKSLYGKGRDLRNVYKLSENEPFKGRVPSKEELEQYSQGSYYTGALNPEYMYYYANAYLKPNENKQTFMSSKEGPFYKSDSSSEDVDRLLKVENMKKEMERYHKNYLKKQKRIEKTKEFANKFRKLSSLIGLSYSEETPGQSRSAF